MRARRKNNGCHHFTQALDSSSAFQFKNSRDLMISMLALYENKLVSVSLRCRCKHFIFHGMCVAVSLFSILLLSVVKSHGVKYEALCGIPFMLPAYV